MYGQTLPATGATAFTIMGVGMSGIWLGFALITFGAVCLALVRIMPRKKV